MLYTIENDRLRVSLASERGGELTSIYGKATDCEYLWQGDPASWAGQAPVLFPICGRLLEGYYTYRGKRYEMLLHGFLRKMELSVTEKTADAITLTATDTENTRAVYPFAFRFDLTYSLSGDTLKISHRVENTGDETMIFALGAHPGFRVPMGDDSCEDYALTFADHVDELTQVVFKNNFTSRAWESYPLSDHKIPYSNELFDAGSLFFANMGDTVTLGSPVSGRFVRLDFAGFPILGLWHAEDTGAPFLCIEPWESVPTYHDKVDDLETKAMMNRLLPGSVYEKAYTVTVG